ncbi:MAG: PHP domain-containing protein [Oscillospiraceae bacterium]|jgi:predicted metal-dependent phosphoesterase TrpH|nr:PHP domain-containing protein [Oscillospiraceae bacterium]
MKLFKYETHLHTKQGSACGTYTGAEMVDYYKSLGYAGFIVTDHFIGGNTAIDFNLPWEKAAEQFCTGFEDAKRRGDEVDFDVFFGFEYGFHGTEFLIYGLDKDWLLKNPQIREPNLRRNLAAFKEAGALIIHAHPFRQRPYIDMLRLLPDLTDAVEVYNALNTAEHNERAAVYAKMYGLVEIAGADAHGVRAQTSGIEVSERIRTNEDLFDVIMAGNLKLIKSS